MQAIRHLVHSRHASAIAAAEGKGTMPRSVPIFDPSCQCSECGLSYRSRSEQRIDAFCYAGSFSRSQAREILNGYVTQITNNREHLKAAVEQYGDTLLHDWKTRSESVRATLLMEVNPTLPKQKPARVHLEYATTTIGENQKNHRQFNLVPYLDVQTLSKDPGAVIGLLDTRIQKLPEEWAPFDRQQINTAWAAGLFQVHFNKDAVKVFGLEYGKLVPWDAAGVHRGELVGFPQARLLLEAQAYIMSFLRKIVSKVLDNSENKKLTGIDKWRHFVQTGLGRTAELYWAHFAFDAFSSPPTFDVDDLLARAKARLDATADHLELLQTEPAYMHRYASIISRMTSVGKNKNNIIGSQMINDEILGDITIHWSWMHTCEELEHLHDMYRQYSHLVTKGEPLPKGIDDALGALELLLVDAAHIGSMQLQAIISQRPGFKR